MNKKTVFLISMMTAALLLTGCIFKNPPILGPAFVPEENVTVERLFEAATAKCQTANTISQKETMELEMEISLMGQKISMSISADVAVDSQGENHHVLTTVNAAAYGTTQKQTLEIYAVPGDIDGKVVVYQNAGTGWTKESTDQPPVNINKAESILTPELAAKMTLQPETAQFNGKECHVVTGKVGWEDINAYADLSQLTDAMGEGVELDLSDIYFEVLYYFAADDLSLQGTSMEGTDAISEVFERLMNAVAGMEIDMEISAFSAVATTDYDVIDEVTVPEEVLNEAGGA
ncbi:MAG: hypothetical protein J5865_02365 [Lachnospiraceae bacterium]|nr:hypothetical protein [Lachnospiraceae bacterium]